MAEPSPETKPSPAAATSVAPDADPDAIAGAPSVILPAPASAPGPDLGGAFLKGMIWSSLSLVISKASSLLATLGLAFVFGDAEYGAFAAARSAAIIGDVLFDGGMRRVLITRGAEYPRIARTAFHVAFAFNLLGCALMCGTATFIHQSDVASQVFVTAIALVIGTLGTVQRAKLVSDLRFARSAFLYTVSSVLRSVLTVAFAWGRAFGPLSFALPIVFVAIWEALYARYTVGRLPTSMPEPRAPGRSLARELISQSKWVIFATIGTSLIARGDYVVASAFFGNETVAGAGGSMQVLNVAGRYMFAFQLTLAFFRR